MQGNFLVTDPPVVDAIAERFVNYRRLESLPLAITRIHPQKHRAPILRVLPARARMDGQNGILPVIFARQKGQFLFLFNLFGRQVNILFAAGLFQQIQLRFQILQLSDILFQVRQFFGNRRGLFGNSPKIRPRGKLIQLLYFLFFGGNVKDGPSKDGAYPAIPGFFRLNRPYSHLLFTT